MLSRQLGCFFSRQARTAARGLTKHLNELRQAETQMGLLEDRIKENEDLLETALRMPKQKRKPPVIKVYAEPPEDGLNTLEAVTNFFKRTKKELCDKNTKAILLRKYKRRKVYLRLEHREQIKLLKRKIRNTERAKAIRKCGITSGYQLFRAESLRRERGNLRERGWSKLSEDQKAVYKNKALKNREKRDERIEETKLRANDYACFVKLLYPDYRDKFGSEFPELSNQELQRKIIRAIAQSWRKIRYAQKTSEPVAAFVKSIKQKTG
eukprot:TRINITY_DN20336_c0_g1_i1.p1 TRINITY_DN20336_c0_g1~~TRINITY_DN20336_c0_g1_i1.p1  ORF type:complete len:267 (+),score=26.45 TRINITY_DN20336_c0_g1_i1:72-872(+)